MEIQVAKLSELEEGVGRMKRAGSKSVVLYRLGQEVFAVDPVCPHWGGAMVEGRVSAKRREVECPWHRFRFDLKTGTCVASNARPALPVYAVDVRDDVVFVNI